MDRKKKAARRFHLNKVKRYRDQDHPWCACCSNPRRNGWPDNYTVQEKRAALDAVDWEDYYDS